MDNCKTCLKQIDDDNNFSGWCKPCYKIQMDKYYQFYARQEGFESLTNEESELITEGTN